jgi:hypothetical protein
MGRKLQAGEAAEKSARVSREENARQDKTWMISSRSFPQAGQTETVLKNASENLYGVKVSEGT